MKDTGIRSTMMTSNRPLEDCGKLLGDVPSATAILDRFLHHAEVVSITGKSYRLRNQTQAGKDSQPAADAPSNPAMAPTGSKPSRQPKTKADATPAEPAPTA